MMIGYLDCFSGISGDMFLGALIDAGWPPPELEALPPKLGLDGVRVCVRDVKRGGIRGVGVEISSDLPPSFRNIGKIEQILTKADLASGTAPAAMKVFMQLARAEAAVHGCDIGEVHFHELGAVDTIVDILGVVTGLQALGIERLHCSPLPLSRGWVDCEHGPLPLPAPACAEIMKGIPVYGVEGEGELITPTGAALVRTLSGAFGPIPPMHFHRVGWGAGTGDPPGRPNLVRLWVGTNADGGATESVTELRTNIDDMNPQWYEYLVERLFEAGALDVALGPIQMKKNRPGVEVRVISPYGGEPVLSEILFQHSTTSGVRLLPCQRFILARRQGTVVTQWGLVRAKLIERPGGRPCVYPEYESCRRVALSSKLPLEVIYRAVSQTRPEDFVDEEA